MSRALLVCPWRRLGSAASARRYSISQLSLVRCSRQIQHILRHQKEQHALMATLFADLQSIHEQCQLQSIAGWLRVHAEKNSSKFNDRFLLYERQRKDDEANFSPSATPFDRCLLHLRYARYLHITSIYRFITFRLDRTIGELHRAICLFLAHHDLSSAQFDSNVFRYELTFFLYSLAAKRTLAEVKTLPAVAPLEVFFLRSLKTAVEEGRTTTEIDQLASTLNAIKSLPTDDERRQVSPLFFAHLFSSRSSFSAEFIRYLTSLANASPSPSALPVGSIEAFDRFLTAFPFAQADLALLRHLLDLVVSMHFSHQLFHQHLLQHIQLYLRRADQKRLGKDLPLLCHLLVLLCSSDPSNELASRPTILSLAARLAEVFELEKHGQHLPSIVHCQHAMMLVGLYNYALISRTIEQHSLPFLFRPFGAHSPVIRRQIFELQQILNIDRPDFPAALFNEGTTRFLHQIHDEYRRTSRARGDTAYEKFLQQLRETFEHIFGHGRAKIISAEKDFPFLLHDFLEVTFPMAEDRPISAVTRVALLPVFNSMVIRQKRSDGKFYRIFNAQTTMRYRIISKHSFLVLPIFFGEFQRAERDQQLKDFFENTLISKLNRRSSP